MVLDKYLSQTAFQSYSDFTKNFKIQIPENFNFAFDVVDEIASKTPDKIAMVWCNDMGEETIFTFGQMTCDYDKFVPKGMKMAITGLWAGRMM